MVRGDCLSWLATETKRRSDRTRYDLIFLDPPTRSTSKAMATGFDVQRDHPELLRAAAGLLADDGVLLFSNNYRKFKMRAPELAGLSVEDITAETIPQDFARSPKAHGCWRIKRTA